MHTTETRTENTADGTLAAAGVDWLDNRGLTPCFGPTVLSQTETDGNLTAVCVCVFSVPWHSSKVIHIIHKPQAPEIILIF